MENIRVSFRSEIERKHRVVEQLVSKVDQLMKIFCHADDGKVLGIHILEPNADQLIAEGTLAIQTGITADDLAHTIHANPTLPEPIQKTTMRHIGGSTYFGRI